MRLNYELNFFSTIISEALTHPYVLNFHNTKEEINKGYDVVPQLNDNVRLTIDEYRNKLYKFIQDSRSDGGKTQNHRPSTNIKSTKQAQQQQQPKSVPVKSAPVATHAKYSTDKNSIDSGDEANYKNYHNNSNYTSSKQHQNQNDNSSDHSDGSSTSGTPPHHNYYNASNASNHHGNLNNTYTSQTQYQHNSNNNGTTSSLSNYNNKRQKHPSEYNTSTNPNKTMPVEDTTDKNYLGGVAGYTGVAFGRTTHPKPPTQAPPTTNNVYTKNHQRSINASRQRSMENLNASMVNISLVHCTFLGFNIGMIRLSC